MSSPANGYQARSRRYLSKYTSIRAPSSQTPAAAAFLFPATPSRRRTAGRRAPLTSVSKLSDGPGERADPRRRRDAPFRNPKTLYRLRTYSYPYRIRPGFFPPFFLFRHDRKHDFHVYRNTGIRRKLEINGNITGFRRVGTSHSYDFRLRRGDQRSMFIIRAPGITAIPSCGLQWVSYYRRVVR